MESSSAENEEPVHQDENEEMGKLLTAYKKTDEELKNLKTKKIKKFYQEQNETIDLFLSPFEKEQEEQDNQDFKLKIAMRGSLVVNCLLFAMQLSAATYSHSLSLISTTVDSFMDILANTILFVTDRLRKKKNVQKYPVGKSRMEPVGIILFASLMAFMSLQILRESIGILVMQENPNVSLDYIPITLSLVGIGLKIGLFIYCRTLTYSPSALTLALDHRNDIVLNSFGITAAVLGHYFFWYIDPSGAILIALIILRSWSTQAYEQVQLLLGRSASPTFLNHLIYTAATHDKRILQVDTCRAFHVGNEAYVELDIVLPQEMTLKESHDIGESLQIKLEKIPGVERAFVHADYSTDHKAEDEHKHPS